MPLFDQVTRGLWQDKHPADENQSPGELNCDWDSVRARIVPLVGGIVDDSGEKKTDSNCELVASYNDTSDPLWCCFGLIERN